MAGKPKFMVFRVLFLFEVHIQQRLYLTGGNSSWSVLEERKLNISNKIKKSITAAKKMQNYIVSGCIKGFLIIC